MTDKKISELTSITGADVSDADDILPIVDTSVATTKKITRAELFQSVSALAVDGNITVGGTVDGRDVASDGTKLDGIEAGADVTDATNVEAAGALMDSEVTNLAAVKAFDPTDYVPQTSATGSAEIPAGTDAERDGTPSAGYFRFNTDSSSFEGYDGASWGEIGGGSGDLSAVAQDIIPDADDTYDLGASGFEWKDLYVDGTANIDSLVADTADINGGTIDGTVIGGSTPAAISGTDLTLSGGVYLGGTGSDNYLDDYEEGTFTPTLNNHSGSAGAFIAGRYVKIGRIVHCVGLILQNSGTVSGGTLQLASLPFTATQYGSAAVDTAGGFAADSGRISANFVELKLNGVSISSGTNFVNLGFSATYETS